MELQGPRKQAVKMHMSLHFSMESRILLTEISLLRKETHMLSELIYLACKKKKLHKDMNISGTDPHCALIKSLGHLQSVLLAHSCYYI